MTAADTLDAWGILRADDVVAACRVAGLDVAYAAVLLVKESGGGRNVWGSDGVDTGGAYVKGAAVTPDAYARYRGLVETRRIGRQGVGPCQLTAADFQQQADRLGGCYRWEINVKIGFSLLASHIARFGERDGFKAYNGGAGSVGHAVPQADVYAAQSMALLGTWRLRLGAAGGAQAPSVPGSVAAGKTLTYGMKGDRTVADVQAFMARVFPAYAAGLPATGNYLDETARVALEFQTRTGVKNADGSRPDGKTIGANTWGQLYAHGYPRKAA